MKKISLCTSTWRLIYIKNSDFTRDGITADPTALRARGYSEIPAEVPGNLELDLMRAGVIGDPFYAANHCEGTCEYLHAIYFTELDYDGSLESPTLVFEGLDTAADIYLNGTFIAHTENMLIAHELDIAGSLSIGKNLLVVHITPAVIAARKYPIALNENAQKYNAESLYLRKAPHMFSWDIMPRIVSAGIWRPVYLKENPADRITEFYMYTVKCGTDGTARVRYHYNTEISQDEILPYTMRIEGSCGDSAFSFTHKLWHTSGHGAFAIDNAKLWFPKWHGEQNLYDVTVTLERDGETVAVHKTRIGIRTVELVRTSTTTADGDGEFCFKVNGERVFCMGTNWVPVDALHSRDAERLPEILPMLDDIHCNIIRLWGGNIYENDILYDYCDEHGILIWQDFIMGCAVYPQDADFQNKLYDEAVTVIKRLRDHPSLLLWAGDNEVDLAYGGWGGTMPRDPNQNVLTRRVLPDAVRIHDYTRPYLPSSPYIDEHAYLGGERTSEDHLWGPRDYFKGHFYKNSICHFASETGYHGCNSPESVKRFIPEEYLWTAKRGGDWEGIANDMWIAHAASCELDEASPYYYRIGLMARQVKTLFGESVPCTLDDFARASQISQAEAKKYFIERFRLSKWKRTGIIWWNLIDGWPQFSDAVVDYYGIKKLAYHYIKRSQEPVALMFDEPSDGVITLYAVNEYRDAVTLEYEVTDLSADKAVASGSALAAADASTRIVSVPIADGEKHFYLIKWKYGGKEYKNHYMTNIIDIDYGEYLGYISSCGFDEFEGF